MKRLLYQTINLVLPTDPIKRLHDLLWGHDPALFRTPAVNSEWRPVEFKPSQQWDVPGFCMVLVPQVLLSEWSWMRLELTHSATTEGGAKISRGRLDTLVFSWVFLLHTFLQRCLTKSGSCTFLLGNSNVCLFGSWDSYARLQISQSIYMTSSSIENWHPGNSHASISLLAAFHFLVSYNWWRR